MSPDTLEAFAKLAALRARQAVLFTELERSILIRDLWPEAFASGGCKTHIEGSKYTSYRFVIVRSDGIRHETPTCDVPRVLLEAHEPFLKKG